MSIFAEQMSDSSHDLVEHVWPLIGPLIHGGTIEPNEDPRRRSNPLDLIAGIDAFQMMPDGMGMRGIASRIQWNDGRSGWPYNTFTIRRSVPSGGPTEVDKRRAALRQSHLGLLYPAVTIQAYVERRRIGPVTSAAAVLTSDLVDYIERHMKDLEREVRSAGAETFYWIPWQTLYDAGCRIRWVGAVPVAEPPTTEIPGPPRQLEFEGVSA